MNVQSSSRRTERLTSIATGVLLVLALGQGSLFAYRYLNPSKSTGSLYQLPPDVMDLRGKALPSMSSLVPVGNANLQAELGKRATIVMFSRTTCPYCQKAQPTLEKLRTKFGGNLGVIVVYGQSQAEISAHKTSLPKFQDMNRKLIRQLKINGVPEFVVLVGGKVQYQQVGYASEIAQELETVVAKSL
jgi:thiol-disulfide isomerase/thioredoxin